MPITKARLADLDAEKQRLRARFAARLANSPALADAQPLGAGARNRHGMPRVPIGQHETAKWPVLDLGSQPHIPTSAWELVIDGEVEEPQRLSWDDFRAMPQIEDVSDFHCVTTWSKLDTKWEGVRVIDLIALARPRETALHLMIHAHDGYTTNVPLWEAIKDDVLLVHTAEGAPLAREHGGPARMITPQLYAWKGAKWVKRLQLLDHDEPGFWEERGYSNSAHPWRNDRYS